MIAIEILQGADQGRTYTFTDPSVSIGRAPDAALSLTDAHLSGRHGVIQRRDDGSLVYRDLDSTNGSMVIRGQRRIVLDDARGRQCELLDGDRLLLGDAGSPVVLSARLLSDDATPKTNRQDEVIARVAFDDMARVVGQLEQGPDVGRLYQAVKMLGGRIELEQVLTRLADAVFSLLPMATHVSVLLIEEGRADSDPEAFVPMLARSRNGSSPADSVVSSRAVLGRVQSERSALLAARAADELGRSESIMSANIRSTMGVPLWEGDRMSGLLQCDNRGSSGMFGDQDLQRLLVVAHHGALAVQNAQLHHRLKLAQETLSRENSYLKKQRKTGGFDQIIGDGPAMQAVFAQLRKVIGTRATVCIYGETGTGKELVASAIHYQGPRCEKMFVAQNCAALPAQLLESELFGHRKGAFTGAEQEKKGLFAVADGGTLFLDEVAEMELSLQAKLLRVLQEGEIRPVGSESAQRVDVRIVCATNRRLEQEVEAGRFREDLYYRLVVFPVTLPPLRERTEDIEPLANHFLKRYAAEMHKQIGGIGHEALTQLRRYRWPGNVRELENEVQRLVIQADEGAFVGPEHLSESVRQAGSARDGRVTRRKGTLKQQIEAIERQLLLEALAEHGHNKTQTAANLGITREGLHKKLAKHGI